MFDTRSVWQVLIHFANVVIRVLQYLKHGPSEGLLYSDYGHECAVDFSNAYWA